MVETDVFEHKNVKPHFINPCCFGEDFAAWLKAKLLPTFDSKLEFSDPIQEDYGWGFWVRHEQDRYWVAVSYVGSGPMEPPAQWVISAVNDPGLNLLRRLFHKADMHTLAQLREHIRKILLSNAAIKIISE